MPSNVPTELPAYIQLKYQDGNAFSELQSSVASVTGIVRRDFEDMAASTKRALDQALKIDARNFSGVDVGVGKFRDLARAQQASAETAAQLAAASARVAQAEGASSVEARRAADAFAALAAKEHHAATEALAHAQVMEKVQAELARSGAQTSRFGASNDNAARSAGAHRSAMMMLGQQMQDATIQAQMGTSALTIFTQQGSQAAFAMANMGGKVGAVASVFAGPWGAAIFAGTALLGPLIAGLFKTADAAEAARVGASGLSDAQGVLGDMFNLTSGKIQRQNELLVLNARLTAVNLRAEALKQREGAKTAFGNFDRGNLGLSTGNKVLGALGVPVYGSTDREQAVRGVLGDLQSGKITREQALAKSEKLDFTGLAITKQGFQQALIDQVSAEFKDRTAKLIDESLDSGVLAKGLRRDAKPKKPKKDRSAEEAERLAKFGETATESIRRLNERFDESPKLIDNAARATRELDAVMDDLAKRQPPGFEKMIAEAKATKTVVTDSLLRPLEALRQESERRQTVQALLARGRDEEVAATQAIWGLEDKLGSEAQLRAKVQALTTAGREEEAAALEGILSRYPAMKREAAQLAEADAQRTRELQRQQELFSAQLEIVGTVRRDLTAVLSGRSTDLLGNLKQSLADLRGQRIFESVFGQAFRDIEDEMRGRSPLAKESQRMATGLSVATNGLNAFTESLRGAAEAAGSGTGIRITTNDNGPSEAFISAFADLGAGEPAATSYGRRAREEQELGRKSIKELADRMAAGIVDPLLTGMGDVLGPRLAGQVGGIVKGTISGYAQAGEVGAALGGLQGIADQLAIGGGSKGQLSFSLGQGLAGAATGAQIGGLAKGLGIGGVSSKGSSLGGGVAGIANSLGAGLGPLGVVGASLLGGVVGGLFKSNRTARALITSLDSSSVGGADQKGYSNASQLGDGVTSGLKRIADAFDAEVGNFMVAIGTRGDQIRVNTAGGSLKAKNGARSFGDDAEAATRYAIQDAIADGALKGMRESSLRILKQGQDLDAALQEALNFENVFARLEQRTDPVGAAIKSLDKQFDKLRATAAKGGATAQEIADIERLYGLERAEAIKAAQAQLDQLNETDAFKDAFSRLKEFADPLGAAIDGLNEEFVHLREVFGKNGASAAQYAQLEELYGRQRAEAVEEAKQRITGSLRSFYDGLGGVTLTQRRTDAVTSYRPLAARVAANDVDAFDDYTEAARRLLDVEQQIAAARGDVTGVTGRLKAITDPIGAAVDAVDREFARLKLTFDDAAASSAEYAQLEQLYAIERAKAAEDTRASGMASLKALKDELSLGEMGQSLGARRAAAQAAFDPLAKRVGAGDATANDEFAAAAKTLLEIERQYSGSQQGYFDLVREVTGLTNSALTAGTQSPLQQPSLAEAVARLNAEQDSSNALLKEMRDLSKAALDRQDTVFAAVPNRDNPFANGPLQVDQAPVVSAVDRSTAASNDNHAQMMGGLDAIVRTLGNLIDALPRGVGASVLNQVGGRAQF